MNQALEAFYAAGIAQDKLWAFPHYLAAAFNDDAEKIAGIIDNNPGRYLSLVALDEATLEQARKVSESLSWKKSPIAIHLLDEAQDLLGETPVLMQVVLSNPDKYGYSLAAYKSRLKELEGTVASQEDSLRAAESAYKILESFKGDWRFHYDRYGKHWSTLIDQREQARLTLTNAEAELNLAQRHEQMLRDEKTEALDRLNSAKEQKACAEKEHHKLIHFIETLWARCETALIKLAQLNEEIQRNEEEILRLNDALEQKHELTENKRTEQNQISNQIDRWNRLHNEPFYSGACLWLEACCAYSG